MCFCPDPDELRAQGDKRRAALQSLARMGVRFKDPARFDLRGTLRCGRNVSIDVNVIVLGAVVLGDGVSIGPNCILEDCRVGADSVVKEFSSVTGAKVGRNTRIGPYARIRPGCEIGSDCQIGNFVEIKQTKMGRKCRINHHSFIGDARFGNDVTMGAGSMTCNHDGTKTQRTTVKDSAYIGSGVMLIAPVTIERKAFVGAGSVIVSNVPANALALARARQISITGWTRKRTRAKR